MYEIKDYPQLSSDWVNLGIHLKILSLQNEKITYLFLKKTYNFKHPEELIRAAYYVELIVKYEYPIQNIKIEVAIPRRTPSDFADIVVFENNTEEKPFITIECKNESISPSEIKQSIEQSFGNANSIRSSYTILVMGIVRIAFDVEHFPQNERTRNIIADIPVNYGKISKYRFQKGNSQNDLVEISKDVLLKKFQQCHNILWEGGKRNPAEAFDEMSKLMFCKIHDERFLTKKNEYYKFQLSTNDSNEHLSKRIKLIYAEAHRKDPMVFEDSLKISSEIMWNVVEILQGISLSKTELDAKGVAFEQFLGSVFRGEMGQYFTPRQIVELMVEFLKPSEKDKIIDPACGSGGFLIQAMENVRTDLYDKLDEKDAYDAWIDFAKYRIFGIEINSQLARIAMMNMILHEDGHSNIENNDALMDFADFDPKRSIEINSFDLLFTNPPFGAKIKGSEKKYLQNYMLGQHKKTQKTEILFIERCISLIKPGVGKMAIILPDGILTNSTLQYVRDYLLEKCQILSIVSLPNITFTHYGAGVKSSIMFLRRKFADEKNSEYSIFMAIADHIGYDATGRNDPKNDLKSICQKYREFLDNNFVANHNE